MNPFVFLCVLCIPAPTLQAQDGFDGTWKRVAANLVSELEAAGVVGGSCWILEGESVRSRVFHGFADLESKRRVDAKTIFHWASVTKTMTGIAAMQLARRGRFKLEDPIVQHIPALSKVHGGKWDVSTITLRHLLSHSSGFRENTWPWGGKAWQPYEPAAWEQLAAMFPYTKLHFEPGSRYSYSNPGLVFVGRVIEQLTGEDYEVHVDKNILKPLGMHDSFFDNTPYHLLKHRSNNYAFRGGKHVANGLDLDTGITVSNGGLNAPIPDMVRYVRFLMGVGDAERHDGVLPRKTLESMWEPQQAAGKAGSFDRSMALTFFVYERRGVRAIGHTGSQRAFQCFILLDPRSDVAAIAAFNSKSTSKDPKQTTRAIMLRFMNTVLEEVFPTLR